MTLTTHITWLVILAVCVGASAAFLARRFAGREAILPPGMHKGVSYIAFGAITLAFFLYLGKSRTETLQLWYFPGNSYKPASDFPLVDEQGRPKVVLVRKAGQMDCYEVFYSQKLQESLERDPSRPVKVTYRISYRLGKSFWIEKLDVAGLGIEPITEENVSGSVRTGDSPPGDCF